METKEIIDNLTAQQIENIVHKQHNNHQHQNSKKNCCGDCKNGGVGACGKLMEENTIVKKIKALIQK